MEDARSPCAAPHPRAGHGPPVRSFEGAGRPASRPARRCRPAPSTHRPLPRRGRASERADGRPACAGRWRFAPAPPSGVPWSGARARAPFAARRRRLPAGSALSAPGRCRSDGGASSFLRRPRCVWLLNSRVRERPEIVRLLLPQQYNLPSGPTRGHGLRSTAPAKSFSSTVAVCSRGEFPRVRFVHEFCSTSSRHPANYVPGIQTAVEISLWSLICSWLVY